MYVSSLLYLFARLHLYVSRGDLLRAGRGDAGHGALRPRRRLHGVALPAAAAEDAAGAAARGLRAGARV